LFYNIPFVKNTDSRVSAYVFLIDSFDREKPRGDGTDNEKKSRTMWVTQKTLNKIVRDNEGDMLLTLIAYVLKGMLND
jgi:hypothetical protein